MLDVRSVSKRFGGATAVADVSLKVAAGEIAGLIGPNGAGKTTLFNLVAGSFRPTSGEIRLDGASIAAEQPHRRMARGLGRTFQIPRPFADMTLVENLLTAAQGQAGERMLANWLIPSRVARQERANVEKAMALLEFLGPDKTGARACAGIVRRPAQVARTGPRADGRSAPHPAR